VVSPPPRAIKPGVQTRMNQPPGSCWASGATGNIGDRTRMKPPRVKRQTAPESGLFSFFPLCRSRRSRQSVSCPDVISVHRCQPRVAAPHTYGGAVATCMATAELPGGCALRPRNTVVPSYRPIHQAG
jgi:hypothetical protein